MKDTIKVKGKVTFTLTDDEGNEIVTETHNTVTAVGKNHIADQLAQTPAEDPMGYMASGIGTPSATALGSELVRKALTSRTASANVVTYVAQWAKVESNDTLTEFGLFNDSPGGTMMLSTVPSPAIVKNSAMVLTVTWELTIA